MSDFLTRFKQMLNQEQINNLTNKKIILFGVGGVGGYVAEMLVRSGIEYLTIVDFDKIDITNINRQIVALNSNVGENKVDVLKQRLKDINPNVEVLAIQDKLTIDNIEDYDLSKYDYVIDCIDDLPAKKQLIKYCNNNNVNILVSCGAGNRYKEIPQFMVADIHKTEYDAIAKILRRFCVDEKIKHLNVVYTKQQAEKAEHKTIGSVVYYPASMACVIVCKVINDLMD